jgi:hypothetical protein
MADSSGLRPLAEIAGSNPVGGHGCRSVVCCQVILLTTTCTTLSPANRIVTCSGPLFSFLLTELSGSCGAGYQNFLDHGPNPRSEESCRMWCVIVRDLEASRMRRSWLALGCCATGKKNTQRINPLELNARSLLRPGFVHLKIYKWENGMWRFMLQANMLNWISNWATNYFEPDIPTLRLRFSLFCSAETRTLHQCHSFCQCPAVWPAWEGWHTHTHTHTHTERERERGRTSSVVPDFCYSNTVIK